MKFLFRVVTLLLFAQAGYAQHPTDGFIVTEREDEWVIVHNVRNGETVASIGHAFHVPVSMVAEANMLAYGDSLKPGTRLYLPLSSYNRKTTLPAGGKGVKKLYYRMQAQGNLAAVAARAKVSLTTLQTWNHLKTSSVPVGTLLHVGWLLYTPPTGNDKPGQIAVIEETPKYVLGNDTPKAHTGIHTGGPLYRDSTGGIVPPLEVLWNEQTYNGKNTVVEKGSAGFFQLTGNAKGASSYAFHSAAARGTVIRVRNIANGKVVFVKVLGPVPATRQYYGCTIGLSNAEKIALGVRESKAFVELSYAGY